MKQTLRVLNDLEARGLIKRYAIGGAVAAMFYMESVDTEDLDVMILLPPGASVLAPLSPIYEALREGGFREDGPYIMVHGVPVQILVAYNKLVEGAVEHAREVDFEGVTTRVPTAEHLLAIMVDTGRAKDRQRAALFGEQVALDGKLLATLLSEYGLTERYRAWTAG